MPPYPKPDAERVRRNAPQFSWTILPAAGREGDPPVLPKGRRWKAATREWWAKLWATPQATQWREDDSELHRLALLHELVWASDAPAATLLAEMRQIEDRHGLNPKAMLQLRWMVEATPEPAQRKVKPTGRRTLRAV